MTIWNNVLHLVFNNGWDSLLMIELVLDVMPVAQTSTQCHVQSNFCRRWRALDVLLCFPSLFQPSTVLLDDFWWGHDCFQWLHGDMTNHGKSICFIMIRVEETAMFVKVHGLSAWYRVFMQQFWIVLWWIQAPKTLGHEHGSLTGYS